ncbi:MAG: HK97 family phage prohead protease [Acidimicrobiales bacterium]
MTRPADVLLRRDLVRLPEPVLDRLARAHIDPGVVQRGQRLEARPWASMELRAANEGSDSVRLVGYATTYEQAYPVYGGAASGWGWDEVMTDGSWAKTISERDDIRLLVNHEGVPLARYRRDEDASTMLLVSDDVGVLVDAGLDLASPLVQTVRSAVLRRDLDQMSCAFMVLRQEWSPDYTQRRILEVKGFDVSVVTYPANEATMVLVDRDAAQQEVAAAAEAMSLRTAQAYAAALRSRNVA